MCLSAQCAVSNAITHFQPVVTPHMQRKWGKRNCVGDIYIVECDSTHYVGLARTVPPTNTYFRLTFFTNPTSGGSL